jgi:hypothetical protein
VRHHEKSTDREDKQERENRDADPAAAARFGQVNRTFSDHRSALQIEVVGLAHGRFPAFQDRIDPASSRMIRMGRW